MKTRNGFVSNSSTSSFVCNVCGRLEAFPDSCSYEDMEIARCVKGHELCVGHLPEQVVRASYSYKENEDGTEEYTEDAEGDYSEIPAERCPVCSLKAVDQQLEVVFLRKVLGWDKAEVLKQVQTRFTTYAEFQAFCKE